MQPIISVENLSKQYRLGKIGTRTMGHDLNRWWHQLRGRENPYLKIGEENNRAAKGQSDYVWALRELQFSVQPGEVLGIIGRNGAGKSTLLKILSRTTAPSTGRVRINGRVASLLEVGTGFHPDLSGRDNIYLNGAILGMTRQEITRKFDEIVAFAGVERYIDTPVKRYSSGMHVRLGFAVAAHLEPDILIVDEVLAVGDAEFQKKCIGKMKDVSENQGRTVLFVSHQLSSIQSLCTNVMILNHGKLHFQGSTEKGLNAYLNMQQFTNRILYVAEENVPGKTAVERISIQNAQGEPREEFAFNEAVTVQLEGPVLPADMEAYVGFTLHTQSHSHVFTSQETFKNLSHQNGRFSAAVTLPDQLLMPGSYYLSFAIHVPYNRIIERIEHAVSFRITPMALGIVVHDHEDFGAIYAPCQWK